MPMRFTIACPHCEGKFHADENYLAEFAGQKVQCTHCQHTFTLPTAPAKTATVMAATSTGTSRAAPTNTTVREGAWRDGELLVMRRGYRLPNRCMACGTPMSGKLAGMTLRPAPSSGEAFAGRIMLHAVIGRLGALAQDAMSDESRVHVDYCDRCAPWIHPRIAKTVAPFLLLGTIVMGGFAAMNATDLQNTVAAIIFGAVALGSLTFFIVCTRASLPIELVHLDARFAWLSGFGENYLAHFPDLAAAQELENDQVAANLASLAESQSERSPHDPPQSGS